MFIQTEETPNPSTLKFLPGRPVLEHGTANYTHINMAHNQLLVKNIFDLGSIEAVFLGSDFISVTKLATANWLTLKPSLLMIIMEYFINHDSVSHETVDQIDKVKSVHGPVDDRIIKEIQDIFDDKIRPAVAQDGGDIVFERFENGIIYVTMQGACSGCPSSSATLKSGIENMLKHYIPEVKSVEAI